MARTLTRNAWIANKEADKTKPAPVPLAKDRASAAFQLCPTVFLTWNSNYLAYLANHLAVVFSLTRDMPRRTICQLASKVRKQPRAGKSGAMPPGVAQNLQQHQVHQEERQRPFAWPGEAASQRQLLLVKLFDNATHPQHRPGVTKYPIKSVLTENCRNRTTGVTTKKPHVDLSLFRVTDQ